MPNPLRAPYRSVAVATGLGLMLLGGWAGWRLLAPEASKRLLTWLVTGGGETLSEATVAERIVGVPFEEAMVVCFVLVLCYAWLQLRALVRDRRYFAGDERAVVLGAMAAALSARPAGFYAPLGDPDDTRDRLRQHVEHGMVSLAQPLRFWLWTFPMLGFLGTVQGLAEAIRLLPAAKPGNAVMKDVMRELYFAFDTTIIGIIAAIVVMMLIQLYERRWEPLELILRDLDRPPNPAQRTRQAGLR